MKLTRDEIIEKLKESKQLITFLFIVSTAMGTSCFIFFSNYFYYGVGFFLYLTSILTIPKINRVREDIDNVKENKFEEKIGKVKSFKCKSNKKKKCKWVLEVVNKTEVDIYEVNKKINIKRNDLVRIKRTLKTKTAVEIEKL